MTRNQFLKTKIGEKVRNLEKFHSDVFIKSMFLYIFFYFILEEFLPYNSKETVFKYIRIVLSPYFYVLAMSSFAMIFFRFSNRKFKQIDEILSVDNQSNYLKFLIIVLVDFPYYPNFVISIKILSHLVACLFFFWLILKKKSFYPGLVFSIILLFMGAKPHINRLYGTSQIGGYWSKPCFTTSGFIRVSRMALDDQRNWVETSTDTFLADLSVYDDYFETFSRPIEEGEVFFFRLLT